MPSHCVFILFWFGNVIYSRIGKTIVEFTRNIVEESFWGVQLPMTWPVGFIAA